MIIIAIITHHKFIKFYYTFLMHTHTARSINHYYNKIALDDRKNALSRLKSSDEIQLSACYPEKNKGAASQLFKVLEGLNVRFSNNQNCCLQLCAHMNYYGNSIVRHKGICSAHCYGHASNYTCSKMAIQLHSQP